MTSEATVKLRCTAPEFPYSSDPLAALVICNRPVRLTGFCKECGLNELWVAHEHPRGHEYIPEVIHVDEGGPCAACGDAESDHIAAEGEFEAVCVMCVLDPDAYWHEYVAPPLALGHEAEAPAS